MQAKACSISSISTLCALSYRSPSPSPSSSGQVLPSLVSVVREAATPAAPVVHALRVMAAVAQHSDAAALRLAKWVVDPASQTLIHACVRQ
jgi:hypothetical protein